MRCSICNRPKAMACKTCGMSVCLDHRSQFFDEVTRGFMNLCNNCGRVHMYTYRYGFAPPQKGSLPIPSTRHAGLGIKLPP